MEQNMILDKSIQKCAEQLTESGHTPFTRGDLIKCIQKDNPEYSAGSINSIIQGVTDNLTGGARGSIGKDILHSVGWGQFILNSNRKFPSSRPNKKHMPIWQHIQKCAEQLTESGHTPFTRGDLIKCIQKDNPECDAGSINPIIQGVADNLKGGAGGAGKNILHSVGWGQFILNSNRKFPSSRPNKKHMPIWQHIQKCAEQLTESDRTPFTRGDLIKCIQKDNPECDAGSINPIIQGVTGNLKGGVGGAGKNILHSVGRGQFILNSNQEFPSSRPNKKYMPIWQHIQKCAEQLTESDRTPFTRGDLMKCIQKDNPECDAGSINPMIQGVTDNLKGEVGGAGKNILHNVGWGQFILNSNQEFPSSRQLSFAFKKKVPKKHSIKPNRKSLELGGYKFCLICKIKPELDEQGSIKEYSPKNSYENSRGLSLDEYGEGPFCKFKIKSESNINIPGVYVIAVNDTPKYVGECEDLVRRFNTGHGNISPSACFSHGQPTNCRTNHLILSEVKKGASVELYFYPTEKFKQIKRSIRSTIKLDWNKI